MKKVFLVLLIGVLSFGFVNFELHPIHISIAEVDYFTKKNEIQVALNIFTDDLEKAIAENGVKLSLDSSKEIDNADEYIEIYLNKYFKIYYKSEDVNKIGELVYLGKEHVEDATWMYFSYKVDSNIDEVEILNNVIVDIYDDQRNIINFNVDREIYKTMYTEKGKKLAKVALK